MGSGKSFTPLSRMHWANLRRRLLLLGAPLAAREPRWLQVLARADGLLERRGARVQRRAVRYRIDGELARRVRVRELADTVAAHALGELHPLLSIGGGVVAAAAAAGLPAGALEPHALIRATMAIRARAASGRSSLLMFSPCVWDRVHSSAGCWPCWSAVGHASSQGSVVLPARMRFSIRRRYVRLAASEHARVDRRGRALYGRSHPRWPTPGSDRGRHRR